MQTKMPLAAAAIAMIVGLGGPASAAPGVAAGVLTCHVSSGWGFIFGSSRSLRCTFAETSGNTEHYAGKISKFGADIGYTQAGIIVWTVLAPQANVSPKALSGNYAGVTASATVGVGVGANALIGGSGHSISLQTLSIEGNEGVNVAAGIAAISLRPAS